MFGKLNTLIKDHGDYAQDDDGSNHHIELEELDGMSDRMGYAKSY